MARKPKWAKGRYTPKNPKKYIGNKKPTYRSSWEFYFMQWCDDTQAILEWSSEPMRIPYVHPIEHRLTTYVPDFLIRFKDRFGNERIEMIEIKPHNQTVLTEKTNTKMANIVKVNHAKWAAAKKVCKANGCVFRVLTEQEMYKL